MMRVFTILLGLTLVSALAAVLADLPGALRLIMGGYQVEVSLTLVAVCALGVLVVVLVLWLLLRALFALPSRPRRPHTEAARLTKIVAALTDLTEADSGKMRQNICLLLADIETQQGNKAAAEKWQKQAQADEYAPPDMPPDIKQ